MPRKQHRKPRYDWDYYRQRYIATDLTLPELAALPNAPKLDTLKKRSAREDWTGQREAFRHQASTKTAELTATTESEVRARHVRIARALQHKALERLQTLDVSKLPPKEVRGFLRDATEIERRALGLGDRVDVTVRDARGARERLEALLARRLGVDDEDGSRAVN